MARPRWRPLAGGCRKVFLRTGFLGFSPCPTRFDTIIGSELIIECQDHTTISKPVPGSHAPYPPAEKSLRRAPFEDPTHNGAGRAMIWSALSLLIDARAKLLKPKRTALLPH